MKRFNPLSKDAEDVSNNDMKVLEDEIEHMRDEHSNGVNRMFPFGPTCSFNGSEVPTFVTCSKNGIITSQLFTYMLSKMDDLDLFDRSDGVNPFLLCDGHVSRFEEPFLEYTLEGNTHWTCCIGVPHGTSMWQVSNNTEQNGTFKIESKKANAETVMSKIRAGLPPMLERTGIVCIASVAWQHSFARVATKKRAIATQGQGLLNYIILDHPGKLQEKKDRVPSISEIYERQVREGVDFTDLASLKTDHGDMRLCIPWTCSWTTMSNKMHFRSYLSAKRRRGAANQDWQRRQAVLEFRLASSPSQTHMRVGPSVSHGHATSHHTRLKKERKATAKERAARLERTNSVEG
jgi:hypothetical protein